MAKKASEKKSLTKSSALKKASKKAVIKTQVTESSVEEFIAGIPDEQKRQDSQEILKIMEKATGLKPKMWGGSIVGFGEKTYKSPTSGREVDWFILGFSPRKANISLYLVTDVIKFENELKKFGKHTTGKGCIYINKLSDIDQKILEGMIKKTITRKGL